MTRPLWRYIVIGLVGGFLSGFAGIGGGVVLIPMIVGLLGVSQHQAHGTSLVIIIPTAMVALTQYFGAPAEGRLPPLDLAVAYSVTAVLAAPLGARLIGLVNPGSLRQLFGLLLLSLAVGSLTRQTPYEPLGIVFLAVGLLALVTGTLVIAARQHWTNAAAVRATPATSPGAGR